MKISQGNQHSIQVHGHRGSRGTHPENTIPAFEEAIRAGADVLELDLQLTSDDIPVVSHDPELTGRLCRDERGEILKAPVPIRSLAATELAKFDCGSVAQARFPEQKLVPGTRIPTLDALLTWAKRTAPQIHFNIETKMTAPAEKWVPPPERFAEVVVALFRRHGLVDRVILQSFDFRTLLAAKKIEPKLRLSCLFENESRFCDATEKIGAQFASPNLKSVTREEVRRCHAKSIRVVPWTANAESEWASLVADGVDAIISDYPRKLLKFLGRGPTEE